MTLASLLCALALNQAGPTTPTAGGEPPARAGIWINAGSAALTAIGGGDTIVVPLGFTLQLQNGPALDFEATYFRWTCAGTASCPVRREDGVFATAGFHFEPGGAGPLRGFFITPKLQLSTLTRALAPPDDVQNGRSFGLEVGLDLGYQWRSGPFYLALVLGGSFGLATHYPSGLYGLAVEWNGSSATSAQLTPRPFSMVYGINANAVRLGFAF